MNIKYKFLVVALSFATQQSYAQFTLKGQINQENNKNSLRGATVYINDLKTGTSTDNNGNFVFKDLRADNYLIEISMVGYKKRVEKINLKGDTTISIALNQAICELNEVVVTAVTRSTELKKSPVIIKTMDANALAQNVSTNIIDAIKSVPGVNQITTGAGISKPIIRGLGYNRVITLNNGAKQEGQQWGDEHGIEVDEYAVDRVEVVKGPGSLIYGSDGIAGVLNLIASKIPHQNEIKTKLSSNYQSNNNLLGYSISNAGSKNSYNWLARFSNKTAGNFQNQYDGKVYNSGFKELNGNLTFGITKNWGYTHLNLSSYNNTLNMPEGERDSLGQFVFEKAVSGGGTEIVSATEADLKGYKVGIPHQKINHLSAQLNNYFILNTGTINVDLGLQNNKRREFANVEDPSEAELFFDLTTINYNVRYNLKEKNDWETSIGVNGMMQKNTNRGEEYIIPNYNLLDAGAFVYSKKTIKNLTIAGGLRFDNRNLNIHQLLLNGDGEAVEQADSTTTTKFDALSKNYNSWSGSLGLTYQISKISTLKINASRGFRAPNIAEIASNGKHEGTLRYEYGSADLKPETSNQIDVAYFVNSDHVSLEVSPFANFINNYIFTKKLLDISGNDSIPDPSDPSPAFQYTQGNATLYGGEIYVDVHPHPLDWLHIENSFSYVNATQNVHTDSTKYLPFTPAPKYTGQLRAQFKQLGNGFNNAYIKFGIDHFFDQNNIYSACGTETATPGYILLNAGIGTNIAFNKKPDFMSLYLYADNLTDVAYQSHLSKLKYAAENPLTGRTGIFNMGRNISLKLVSNF